MNPVTLKPVNGPEQLSQLQIARFLFVVISEHFTIILFLVLFGWAEGVFVWGVWRFLVFESKKQ